MSRTKALWILLFIIIVGVLIRSYSLTDRSLWFDEAFSWRLIQFPMTEMIERDIADVHPPLYYIVLKGWSVIFGTSLLALRAFSVTMAGLTIAAGYLFASSSWRSRVVGLTAAALLAVSGWQVAFAWEARMYTFGTLLALLSSWILLKAVRQSHLTFLWWVAYGVAAAAFAYIHYFAFFTLAAHALFVAGHILVTTKGRVGEIINMRTTWYAVVSALVAILIYLPWITPFIQQNQQVQQDGWWPEPITNWTIPNTFYKMFIPMVGGPANTGWEALITLVPISLTIIGWLALLLLCRKGKFSSEKGWCDAAWLTVLAGAVPFIMAVIMSSFGQSIYQDRFLVFSQLFILIGLAALLWQIKIKYVPTILTTLLIIMLSWSFVSYWQEIGIADKPGARAATRYVIENRSEDEPVLVSSPFIYFAVEYYSKEELGNVVDPSLYSDSGKLSHFSGGPILTPEDVTGPDFVNDISTGDILWVVDTTGFGGTELDLPGDWQKETSQVFPEVFPHQGDVIINKYVKE